MTRRVDPRRPFVVTPQGLRRSVLGSEVGERDLRRLGGEHAPLREPRLRGAPAGCLLVLAHTDRGSYDEHAREAIAAAALLARADEAVLVISPSTDDAVPADLAGLGLDELELLVCAAAQAPDALARAVATRCRERQPRLVIAPDRGADGELARRVAVALGWPAAGSVVEIADQQARVRDGGSLQHAPADATAALDSLKVLLVERQVARGELPFLGQGAATVMVLRDGAPARGIRLLETSSGRDQRIALEEAEFILAAGNGVQDVTLFHELAAALGAAVGASRVAVDDGRFPRHQQIGATGKTVQARGYLAIGISGAVQHLQGIRECRHVLAVNTDTSAPIAQRSELFVAEDAQALMKALLQLVRGAPSLQEATR